MIVELRGGPCDGEWMDLDEVEHDEECAPGCDVPEFLIDLPTGPVRYARCPCCDTYEYVPPDEGKCPRCGVVCDRRPEDAWEFACAVCAIQFDRDGHVEGDEEDDR